MNLLTELITIDRNSETPIYLQLANGLIFNIRRGQLRRGLKLPGSRKLAGIFNIQRNTVLAAFDELLAQGWLKMLPQKGTYIADSLPEIKPSRIRKEETLKSYPASTHFFFKDQSVFKEPVPAKQPVYQLVINDGFPDARLAPMEELLRELKSLAHQPSFRKYYTYSSPMGPSLLRETLASFLSDTRGLPITAGNLMITRGAQMGIYLAARLLLKPGDGAVVGEPGYSTATRTFQQVGATVHFVPVDEEGIDVDRIEALCKRKKIRLIYVIPHHHNPTTVTLNPERRIRLLQLAAQYKFAIIEDDYDYDFHYTSNPVLPLASLDYQGNVIYVGTLSKTLVPAVRVGFMVAPPDFIEAAANWRRSIDLQGDTITEIAIAQLYRNGAINRHIKKSVKLYHQRRDHFCELLTRKIGSHIIFKIPDGGMSVWARFQGVDLKSISKRAIQKGLSLNDGSKYNRTINYNACRMGFASLNEKEQSQAIDILLQSI